MTDSDGAQAEPSGRRAPTSTYLRHVNVPFSQPSELYPQKDGRKVRSRWKGTFVFRRDSRMSRSLAPYLPSQPSCRGRSYSGGIPLPWERTGTGAKEARTWKRLSPS